MKEYMIINDDTGLVIDSFTTKSLALSVLKDYQKLGFQCHLEAVN